MVKKSGDEYVVNMIWKEPKEKPKRSKLEDEVDTSNYETFGDTGFPYHPPSEPDTGS